MAKAALDQVVKEVQVAALVVLVKVVALIVVEVEISKEEVQAKVVAALKEV